MLTEIITISRDAGDIILKYYNDPALSVRLKEDESPLTLADTASNDYICTKLEELYNIPIISEEKYQDYEQRKNYSDFFLVDPLDGTKEFIEGRGEFTVNIAYVKNNKPFIGVIHTPVSKTTYFASHNSDSFVKDEQGIRKLPLHTPPDNTITATGSRKHSSSLDSEFARLNNIEEVIPAGSSLKFCKIAMGSAHLYPRFQGSMEWDIAAGHIIAKEAGCSLIDLKTGKEPLYNKQSLLNNYFLVLGRGIDISSIKIPEM